MIRVTTFAGKAVAVFGLGSSGIATARALSAGGAEVAAWDDGEAGRASAVTAGVALVDLTAADWSRFGALILAPGVPLTHPEPHWSVTRARAAGVEVIGDMELFFRERARVMPGAEVVAITGTNGKSTTTALIAHILRKAGRDVAMGGNIGVPVLALAPFAPGRIHVLEMSSFQIDLTPSVAPTVGVLLNITPDHLDRHGTMENYAAVKERLVAGAQRAVVVTEDAWCTAIAARIAQSGRPLVRAATIQVSGVATLRGRHNGQNAGAAGAAARELGVPAETITSAFSTYPGLPHRMEEVGRLAKADGEVVFVNDSKATNADSTDKALASWDGDIFLILGGKPKAGGITTLAPHFPRIAKAFLIGEASEDFAATLAGKVAFERCGTLQRALAAACRDALASAAKEPVVLLSPACASYDQFTSFEHRGNEFRRLVREIPGVAVRGQP